MPSSRLMVGEYPRSSRARSYEAKLRFHLAGTLLPVHDGVVRPPRREAAQVGQLLHGGLDTGGDVEHGPALEVALQRQLQGASYVVDVGIVARGETVAVDDDGLPGMEGPEEQGHGSLLAGAPGTVDIGEAEGDRAQPVRLGEGVGVALSGQFARPVGRDWLGQRALADGRHGVADKGAPGGGLHDTADAGPSRRVEHAEGPEGIDVEVRPRVLDRHDHRTGGREVHDGLHSLEGAVQVAAVTDVAFDEVHLDAVEVGDIARGEVVEDSHLVSAGDEPSHECRPYEAGATGDENSRSFSHWRSPGGS